MVSTDAELHDVASATPSECLMIPCPDCPDTCLGNFLETLIEHLKSIETSDRKDCSDWVSIPKIPRNLVASR